MYVFVDDKIIKIVNNQIFVSFQAFVDLDVFDHAFIDQIFAQKNYLKFILLTHSIFLKTFDDFFAVLSFITHYIYEFFNIDRSY